MMKRILVNLTSKISYHLIRDFGLKFHLQKKKKKKMIGVLA